MRQPRLNIKFLLWVGVGLAALLVWVLISTKDHTFTATSATQPASSPDSPGSALTGEAGKSVLTEGFAVPVQVLKPQRRDVAYTLTLPANVSPWYQATLYAKVPGYLKWMGFDKGDQVKKGQLLAVIDAPEVEEQYRQAQADYKIKKVTYQRLANVWKENPDVIAKQDVDMAEAAAEAAKHLMESRRTLLDYTKVYAPFSGVITARFADPGAMIQAATGSATQAVPLYTLMDLDTVRVYASVPQEAALLAKPGIKVVLTSRELAAQDITGAITRTTEALDPATRTLLVEIDVPNKDRRLQPGMFVNATFYLREHPNALVLPPSAIASGGPEKTKSVFVVRQGKAHRTPIKTDIDDGVWVEVVEGLTDDDEVVIVGKTGLTDGKSVLASPYNLPSGKPSSQKY